MNPKKPIFVEFGDHLDTQTRPRFRNRASAHQPPPTTSRRSCRARLRQHRGVSIYTCKGVRHDVHNSVTMFAPSTLNEIQLFLYAIVGSLDRYIVVDTLRSYDPIRNNFRPPKNYFPKRASYERAYGTYLETLALAQHNDVCFFSIQLWRVQTYRD